MALVIDSSTPAAATGDFLDQYTTTASFTPPDSPLLICLAALDVDFPPTDPTSVNISSTPSQTWVRDAWDHRSSGSPTEDGQAAFWHAVVTGTPGATTVTVANQYSAPAIVKVLVITGHDPAGPVGAAQGGRQGSGSTLSDSYTASITGGQGFLVVCDWAAGATSGWTAATGCTVVDKGTISGSISYAVVQRTAPDGVVGVATTVGLTGLPTGGVYHWVIAEVISLEAAIAARDTKAQQQQQFATATNW